MAPVQGVEEEKILGGKGRTAMRRLYLGVSREH